MNPLYKLVNAFDGTGKWLGMFMDEETAREWLKKSKYDLTKCEISNRKVERKISKNV